MPQEERADMFALMQEACKPISDKLDKLFQEQEELRTLFAEIREGQAEEKQGYAKLLWSMTKLELKMKQETDRTIKVLSERFSIFRRNSEKKRKL